MKTLTLVWIGVACALVSSPLSAQHDYGGESGHAPFHHDHSGNCGGYSGGVCYGYAMGTMAGMCSAATMIPANTCNGSLGDWAGWGIISDYFEYHNDPKLVPGL
jgi:hypothetical protein